MGCWERLPYKTSRVSVPINGEAAHGAAERRWQLQATRALSTRLVGEMNSRRRRSQLLLLTARQRVAFAAACGSAKRAFLSPLWPRSEQRSTAAAGPPARDRELPRQPLSTPHYREAQARRHEQSFVVPCAEPLAAPAELPAPGRAVAAARPSGVRPRRDLPHVRTRRRSGQLRPPDTCFEAGCGASARCRFRSGREAAPARERGAAYYRPSPPASPYRGYASGARVRAISISSQR